MSKQPVNMNVVALQFTLDTLVLNWSRLELLQALLMMVVIAVDTVLQF